MQGVCRQIMNSVGNISITFNKQRSMQEIEHQEEKLARFVI